MLIFGPLCVMRNLIERHSFISKTKSGLAHELPVTARLQLGGERQGRQMFQEVYSVHWTMFDFVSLSMETFQHRPDI